MDVNGEIFISSRRTLRFLWARSAAFGAADIGMGTIANVQADIVQLLSCRTTVAVALGLIGKSLGAIAGVVLSQSTVARAHVRRDAAIQQPLQKLPIAIGGIGCYRRWLSPLPLHKVGDHVLCRDRLLTHACRRGLDSNDHATVIVDQVVIVVPQASRGATLGGVGGIGIGSRHLILFMYRILYRVLLFELCQILTQRVMDLGRFR